MKTLLVRLSAIGDVVHTLPAAAALRKRGHEVDWIVEPPARPLVEGNPAVSRAIAAPPARLASARRVGGTARELRRARYDAAIDLQGLWKSAAWARLSGARRTVGFAGPWRREPLSEVLVGDRVQLQAEPGHVVDKNLALLRALGIEAVGSREFPLPPAEAESRRVASALDERRWTDFAILNPGGGWESKLWPVASFAVVAQGMAARGIVPVVTWGPGEERRADEVVAASKGAAARCFPTTLLEYAELARRARVVVAADTGPLHLACAVGAPVVGVFGPTDPGRNGPCGEDDVTVRRLPLCAPCHRRHCAIHEGVMAAVPPTQVLDAVDRRLARAAKARRTPAAG
jgi:lipopolysaccharide heptosyltransferase I